MQLWVNTEKVQLFHRGKVLEAELKHGPIPSKQQVPAQGEATRHCPHIVPLFVLERDWLQWIQ